MVNEELFVFKLFKKYIACVIRERERVSQEAVVNEGIFVSKCWSKKISGIKNESDFCEFASRVSP